MAEQRPKKPDKREYTLMVVPHHGQNVRSIRIPIKAVKAIAAVVSILVVVMLGAVINYRITVNTAGVEKNELEKLRVTNNVQMQKIEQLAKATTALQDDMNRLNALDADLRRVVNNEEITATSRAGLNRPVAPGGQGGPNGPAIAPQLGEIEKVLQDLQASVKVREQSLEDLKDSLIAKKARAAATPSIWPTTGEVTSRFGWRSSPWGWGSSDYHPGIDIADAYGTPIQATADGVVVHSDWYGGYGRMVKIDHGNGIETIYGHTSQTLVSEGTHVKKGQTIAYMGNSGYSTGTHLHYEVRVNGTAVNPASFL